MARSDYQKLCGASLMSLQRCYLGTDHLLILDGRFTESVKQIRYADIEATLIAPTGKSKVTLTLWGLLGLAACLFAFAFSDSWALFFWLGVLLFAAGAIIYSLVQEGSAELGVQTAVQTVVLHGAGTRRKATKAEARLAERIEAAQGTLTREALQASMDRFRSERRTFWEAQKASTYPNSPQDNALTDEVAAWEKPRA